MAVLGKKLKNLVQVAVLVGLGAGCSDPKSVVISTAGPDKEKMQEAVKKLTEEERQLVTAYILRTFVAGGFAAKAEVPTGTTIGDAIKQQKQWAEAQQAKATEQAALEAKLAAEMQAFVQEVENIITVAVLEKSILPKNIHEGRFTDVQIVKLGFANKSGKDIAGISGQLAFYDIFEKEVGVVVFSYDGGVKAGQTAQWIGKRGINEFVHGHTAIANLEDRKYTAEFRPDIVVFADGTKLKAKGIY